MSFEHAKRAAEQAGKCMYCGLQDHAGPSCDVIRGPGHDALYPWFGRGVSFAVLPRVLMECMPDDWQGKMVTLLRELDDAFPGAPASYTVRATVDRKLVPMPGWLLNYRYPEWQEIAAARKTDDAVA